MKKIVLNISDTMYEKIRFEAIEQEKDVQTIVRERFFCKPFSKSVEEAYENWVEKEFKKMTKE